MRESLLILHEKLRKNNPKNNCFFRLNKLPKESSGEAVRMNWDTGSVEGIILSAAISG